MSSSIMVKPVRRFIATFFRSEGHEIADYLRSYPIGKYRVWVVRLDPISGTGNTSRDIRRHDVDPVIHDVLDACSDLLVCFLRKLPRLGQPLDIQVVLRLPVREQLIPCSS